MVAVAGATAFIVHARNAVLKGLSPKENREIPPLKYPSYQLKRLSELAIVINGGIATHDAARELAHVDGNVGKGRLPRSISCRSGTVLLRPWRAAALVREWSRRCRSTLRRSFRWCGLAGDRATCWGSAPRAGHGRACTLRAQSDRRRRPPSVAPCRTRACRGLISRWLDEETLDKLDRTSAITSQASVKNHLLRRTAAWQPPTLASSVSFSPYPRPTCRTRSIGSASKVRRKRSCRSIPAQRSPAARR